MLSRNTQLHLIYQFIITTLILCGIAYLNIHLDSKIVKIFSLLPLTYYIVIIAYSQEIIPIPQWMNEQYTPDSFLNQNTNKCEANILVNKSDSIIKSKNMTSSKCESHKRPVKKFKFEESNEISSQDAISSMSLLQNTYSLCDKKRRAHSLHIPSENRRKFTTAFRTNINNKVTNTMQESSTVNDFFNASLSSTSYKPREIVNAPSQNQFDLIANCNMNASNEVELAKCYSYPLHQRKLEILENQKKHVNKNDDKEDKYENLYRDLISSWHGEDISEHNGVNKWALFDSDILSESCTVFSEKNGGNIGHLDFKQSKNSNKFNDKFYEKFKNEKCSYDKNDSNLKSPGLTNLSHKIKNENSSIPDHLSYKKKISKFFSKFVIRKYFDPKITLSYKDKQASTQPQRSDSLLTFKKEHVKESKLSPHITESKEMESEVFKGNWVILLEDLERPI